MMSPCCKGLRLIYSNRTLINTLIEQSHRFMLHGYMCQFETCKNCIFVSSLKSLDMLMAIKLCFRLQSQTLLSYVVPEIAFAITFGYKSDVKMKWLYNFAKLYLHQYIKIN